jgi:hypothetical protein
VTIKGTIAKTASGEVAVTYRQKTGRTTASKSKLVRIKRGKWSAKFSLPKRIAKSKQPGQVIATYQGDEDTANTRIARKVAKTKYRR